MISSGGVQLRKFYQCRGYVLDVICVDGAVGHILEVPRSLISTRSPSNFSRSHRCHCGVSQSNTGNRSTKGLSTEVDGKRVAGRRVIAESEHRQLVGASWLKVGEGQRFDINNGVENYWAVDQRPDCLPTAGVGTQLFPCEGSLGCRGVDTRQMADIATDRAGIGLGVEHRT